MPDNRGVAYIETGKVKVKPSVTYTPTGSRPIAASRFDSAVRSAGPTEQLRRWNGLSTNRRRAGSGGARMTGYPSER